jgi:DNA excision repair protein ERCC-2
MLDAVYEVVSKGEHGVLMIDAPTGTGKTSCISSVLAAAPGKTIVAVRTVSQIDIYIEEIGKIWARTRHRPEIAYMVGKQKICPLDGEFRGESVYAGCSRLKEWTKNYVSSRIGKSEARIYDPALDNIPEEEPGYRTFCPYYLRSREGFDLNGTVHFRRSGLALDVVEGLKKTITPPSELLDSCQGICPYEIQSLYAKNCDIVIMNYSHLFSPDSQDIIFQWLEMESEKVTLIIDEAHNLGDGVRAMNSRILSMRMIDLAEREVEKFEGSLGQARLDETREGATWRREGIRVIRMLLPRLKKFLQSKQERMQEGEALLDADLFRTFLYNGLHDIDESLSNFSDVAVAVADLNLAESDRENLQGEIQPSLALVLLYLMDVESAEKDPSYQRKIIVTGSGGKRFAHLEVNNIDPATNIRRVTDNINATIMFSGTFSPLEAYELYCLGEENRATKLSLPNPFPKENRLIMATKKATTQLDMREDADNREELSEHIRSIIECVPGSVAIFFTSYPMMNNYRQVCLTSCKKAGKKLCVEPRGSEEVPSFLQEFFSLAGRGGGVLTGVCGGKLAEGIDYKGEALNGVAVVGLPLATYDEIQKEINGYYTRKYGRSKGMLIAYTLPAVNRGLQAAGRVIRSESERGVILFCDRRFGDSGQGSVSEFLPDWVKEDMILVDAKEGREMIIKKIADWKMKGPSQSRSQSLQNRKQNGGALNANQQAAKVPERSKSGNSAKATKSGKRDLRELARALGLGTGTPAGRAAPKPGQKNSREKGQN